MQKRLLDIIACPNCRGTLSLNSVSKIEDKNIIISGELKCIGCTSKYSIINGIPRLMPTPTNSDKEIVLKETRTVEHFHNEFTVFSEGNKDLDPPKVLEYYFFSRTGIDPTIYTEINGDFSRTFIPIEEVTYTPNASVLAGKVVLDAGCGPGRLTKVAASKAEYVVGLDLGAHIDRAARYCKDLNNVDFVQGSVLNPPFRHESFDYIFSIGVLHHTPDPQKGCFELVKLVKDKGAISIWVYPPEYWGGPLRKPISKQIHSYLSKLSPDKALNICANWLYPIGRIQMKLASRRWSKLLTAPLFLLNIPRHPQKEEMIATIYDYYCPLYISTHTYEELLGWLKAAGCKSLRRLPVPTAYYAEKGSVIE
jgi:uncharacterized protein YbaR (Trm112 family)/SAM-dependent methyltransferase